MADTVLQLYYNIDRLNLLRAAVTDNDGISLRNHRHHFFTRLMLRSSVSLPVKQVKCVCVCVCVHECVWIISKKSHADSWKAQPSACPFPGCSRLTVHSVTHSFRHSLAFLPSFLPLLHPHPPPPVSWALVASPCRKSVVTGNRYSRSRRGTGGCWWRGVCVLRLGGAVGEPHCWTCALAPPLKVCVRERERETEREREEIPLTKNPPAGRAAEC